MKILRDEEPNIEVKNKVKMILPKRKVHSYLHLYHRSVNSLDLHIYDMNFICFWPSEGLIYHNIECLSIFMSSYVHMFICC